MKPVYRIALLSMVLILSSNEVRSAPPATTEQILKIWQAREEKVKTARFEWEKKEIVMKGTYSRLMGRKASKEADFQPLTDITLEGKCKLSIGTREEFRYNYEGTTWSAERNAVDQGERVSTFNGSKYKRASLGNVTANHGEATIKSKPDMSELRDLGIKPLWLAVRGYQSVKLYGFSLLSYEPTGVHYSIGGRNCYEYTLISRLDDSRSQIYFDPDNDYRLVRMVESRMDSLIFKLDVNYSPHPEVGWLPSNWEYVTKGGNGSTQVSIRCNLTKAEINPTFHESEMDATLPPGTRVSDYTSGKEVQHVVRDNGKEGTGIALEGRAITYEQLTEANKFKFPWRIVLLVSSALLVVVSAAALVRRRFRHRKMVQNSTRCYAVDGLGSEIQG